MKKKKEIQEELEDLNSILSKKELKDDFEIPENYFENFQKDVFNTLSNEGNEAQISSAPKTAKVRKLNFKKILPIAASMALLIGLFFFVQNQSTTETFAIEELSSEDIEFYINENIEEFDVELLSMLETDEQNSLIPDDVHLDDYLQDNIDDLDESLIDELF